MDCLGRRVKLSSAGMIYRQFGTLLGCFHFPLVCVCVRKGSLARGLVPFGVE